MKMSYKLSLIIASIVSISVVILLITFDFYNYNYNEKVIYQNIENNTTFISGQIDDKLIDLILLSRTIGNIDSLKEDLNDSNTEFENLSILDRDTLITDLNNTWIETSDINDPFIQDRMNNDFALFLESLEELDPDLYGEAFITNKFGVMISTSSKLTTLAHFDKYWWQGAYNDGEGLIFLDDRGFDESVGGYVLGIVVPIYDNDEIIGILKVNFNIENILSSTMADMISTDKFGEFEIVRSKGLIVSKEGITPLSESIEENLLSVLLINEITSGKVNIDNEDYIYCSKPIEITLDNDEIVFGGSFDSVDHSLGNLGEHWNVIYTISDENANIATHETLITMIYGSSILIVITIIISIIVANRFSKPIVKLQIFVKKFGLGDFSLRIEKTSNDEIGVLTESFNEMADNMDKTLISKNILEKEIKEKEILEMKLIEMSRIDVLTSIYNRRAFNDFYNSYYERAIRYKEDLAVIIFDIDDFKLVNDEYGHLIGDKVLIKLSLELTKLLRVTDIFARWGGEEFIILAPNIKNGKVLEFSERIRKHVANIDFEIGESITISLGIGILESNDTKDSILKKADDALYKAKSEGKNATMIIK